MQISVILVLAGSFPAILRTVNKMGVAPDARITDFEIVEVWAYQDVLPQSTAELSTRLSIIDIPEAKLNGQCIQPAR